MSHIATVQTEFRDIEAVATAAQHIGLEFDRNATSFRWYAGQRSTCNGVLRVPGNPQAHEVGLVKQADGSYAAQYDPWQGGYGLEKLAGKNLMTLRNEYAATVAVRQLARQGYRVTRQIDKQGRLQLVATK